MLTTPSPTIETTYMTIEGAPAEPAPATPVRSGMPLRLAGIGGLAFATTVVLQNAIRGSSSPTNGASPSEVLAHYSSHRPTVVALVALFVIGALGLTTFLGGVVRRGIAGPRPAWAYTGLAGATGILALFASLVASEQAVSVVASGDSPDTSAVGALWALHNSVFTVLLLFIGIALLGLSRAGIAAGITPRVFRWLAPVGTALLALGCLAGPAIAGGDLMGVFGVSVAGFVVWLAFVVSTSVRLIRLGGGAELTGVRS